MPIHRPDDPHDVISMAASSLRLVGGILLLLVAIGMTSIGLEFEWEQLINGDGRLVGALLRTMSCALVGAAFLVAAFFVKRRHAWAAIMGMCLSAMATLAGIILAAALFVLLGTPQFGSPWFCVPMLLVALFTFAVGTLTFHLSRTLAAIRLLNPRPTGRGFEAIPPLRASPLPPPPLADQQQTS
jgi:hypothetical protein